MTTEATAAPTGKYFDDFEIGDTWDSPARTITEADLVMIQAGFSSELQSDPHRRGVGEDDPVRRSHLPRPWRVCDRDRARVTARTQGGNGDCVPRHEFQNLKDAVRIGDTIQVRSETIAEKKPSSSKPDRGIVTFDVQVLNQRDEVCQDGQWVVMFSRRQS